MNLDQRIHAFAELGKFFAQFVPEKPKHDKSIIANDALFQAFSDAINSAENHNNWFTKDNVKFAIKSWSEVLTIEKLTAWLAPYHCHNLTPKKVAIIMAGNIPLVGFHDFLAVLLTGHNVLIKQSSKDQLFLPLIVKFLEAQDAAFAEHVTFTSGKLDNYDAVIATGSNNTARYFEHYFGNKPNIIRKNRTSVAVLTGNESKEQLEGLSDDIFRYFGLGCRNVSKLYVPENYDLNLIFGALYKWKHLIEDKKYTNNYDYNKAVYLMSEFDFLDNGFAMLKKDEALVSPIASIFYEYYTDGKQLINKFKSELSEQIQCIVASNVTEVEVAFGTTQKPKLTDYADGVDTVDFLLKI